MAHINGFTIDPPLVNTSCAWASEESQLQELYDCPYTGAVTTRTACGIDVADAFDQKEGVHGVRSATSINTYGYSPHSLKEYLSYVDKILSAAPNGRVKPFIVSLTATSPEILDVMISKVQTLRETHPNVGIELNTSCPNVGHPPSAYAYANCTTPAEYNASELGGLIAVFQRARAADPTLAIGLKLSPFVYAQQITAFVRGLASLGAANPVAFLTCTNTLGNSFLPASVLSGYQGAGMDGKDMFGGLAGEAIHSLSLGNVAGFRKALDASCPEVAKVEIIGAGGVTTADAARRMYDAGASVVGCATLLGKAGIGAFKLLTPGSS
ncbi:FMN-linked oxidoreductase [Fistulina hepatica ATCC 64428]|uniref:Dihydroorotate oxidase n=1 Tax=Fistulina hepatica ATCC 64428 TaxID=1128425 RepID=A0A0D7A2J9_9AGAR|nr:FMN-linked oxidoreductase [Fistulina hepatica ATCC 64428]